MSPTESHPSLFESTASCRGPMAVGLLGRLEQWTQKQAKQQRVEAPGSGGKADKHLIWSFSVTGSVPVFFLCCSENGQDSVPEYLTHSVVSATSKDSLLCVLLFC